jgi:(R,R)-butanediol dehydrogenase/meso-butanediol dehydrogenase/diacetyl reductase
VGKSVEGWKPGDRVVVLAVNQCRTCDACMHGFASCCQHGLEQALGSTVGEEWAGGFSKFVRVPTPERRLFHLPDQVSFEEGALVDPVACSLHVVRISNFKPGDYTMVLGAGPIGLGVILFLKMAGAGVIIATEVKEKRIELAKKFGADYVFNPQKVSDLRAEVLKVTNGLGVNQVFDCSGLGPVFKTATQYLRPRGQIVLYGAITKEIPILPLDFVFGEYQLQAGLWVNDEFPMVIDYFRKGVLPAKEMITSKIKLEDIVEKGLNKLLDPNSSEIKVLVSPD